MGPVCRLLLPAMRRVLFACYGPIACATSIDVMSLTTTITKYPTQATGMNTFFGKTAQMIQAVDDSLGNLQKILLKMLVVLSVTLCTIAFIFLMVSKGESFKEALSFAVVLLVASIPIAIEIVSTATLALGSRQLSEHGAIVTRLTSIEEMAGMNMLCSDKTGTLTLNKMVIQEFTPTFVDGLDQKQLLLYAAMAAKWKEPPRDALDTLVLGSAALHELEGYEMVCGEQYLCLSSFSYRSFQPILRDRDLPCFRLCSFAISARAFARPSFAHVHFSPSRSRPIAAGLHAFRSHRQAH